MRPSPHVWFPPDSTECRTLRLVPESGERYRIVTKRRFGINAHFIRFAMLGGLCLKNVVS